MSRRTARKHIFNMIFQIEFHNNDIDSVIEDYLDTIQNESSNDILFIKKEIHGVVQNKQEIDEIISNSAVGWSVERIAKVDIAIMRLAVYELIYAEDVPESVSINEALELAKEFSSDKAPSFINGILGKAVNIIADM